VVVARDRFGNVEHHLEAADPSGVLPPERLYLDRQALGLQPLVRAVSVDVQRDTAGKGGAEQFEGVGAVSVPPPRAG